MSQTCPQCEVVAPPDADRCECGYSFHVAPPEKSPEQTLPRFSAYQSGREPPAAGGGDREVKGSHYLPAPLADPLRSLRGAIGVLNRLFIVFGLLGIVFFAVRDDSNSAVLTGLGAVFGFWILSGIRALLPRRTTDILYLRSFRTDDDTAGIRKALDGLLDPTFRLSGIRQPGRRGRAFFRFVNYTVFVLKYASPKYLNLEAGDEWKARLWRSLGEARGVIIDVTDLTPAVIAEVRLCAACVGLTRMLFVVRGTRSSEEWVSDLVTILGEGISRRAIRLARWDSPGFGRLDFDDAVRRFADRLPDRPAGFNPNARALAEQVSGEHFQESSSTAGYEVVVGLVLGLLGVRLFGFLGTVVPQVAIAYYALLGVWFVTLVVYYVSFVRNTGSRRRRRIAFWAVFVPFILPPLLGVAAGMFLPAFQKVREAASRMACSNNLRQLALAMGDFHDANNRLPGANDRPLVGNGVTAKHPVSWRVQLLPYLGEDELYKQYRFDEPWDGPNNIQLLSRMPKVFACPSAGSHPDHVGHTHYRVFASPRFPTGPSPIFQDGVPGRSFSGISDGLSNTILVAEAQESVPWTQPDFMPFFHDQPLPRLGGLHVGVFNVAMGDGSVRAFRSALPEQNLKAWITADGGEVVPDN